MNTETKMPRRTILVGGAVGLVLLLVGVGLGLLLAGAGPRPDPALDAAAGDEPMGVGGGMEGMDGMQGIEGTQGMAMGGDGTVRIAHSVAGALGITSVAAELGSLRRAIRSTGHVAWDETRLSTVSPKFSGWVERLHVDFTGRFVQAGEPLLEIYSPELVSAQEELLAARRLEASLTGSVAPGVAERTTGLVEATRRRLLLWDISSEQIREIEETGEIRRTLTLHAPRTGFVVEKDVSEGAGVQPGTALYRMADLSRVWLEIDVYEADLRFARTGDAVEVRVDAYPDERWTGRITYVYPDVDRGSRTARIRIELPNPDPDRRLMPGMFATAHLDALVAERALLVPRDAVMRGGERDLVFVEVEPGTYAVREVQVGATADGRTQILRGLLAGDRVVARANFIVDAESRLMETMMGQPGMPGMEMDMEMGDMDMGGGGADPHASHEH
jgi:membrane fusion protein, copper/silver efflux system